MKKFKTNKITTFMFAMLEVLSPFSIGIPLMMLLLGKDNYTSNDILMCFPLFILTLVLIVAFCCLLNLVTLPFNSYTVFLFDDHFSWGNINVRYDEVDKIVIDSGFVRRSDYIPCCLDFYSENNLLISIKHPSLLMTFFVTQRCRNAKLRYKRVKKLIFLWLFCLLVFLFFGLHGDK